MNTPPRARAAPHAYRSTPSLLDPEGSFLQAWRTPRPQEGATGYSRGWENLVYLSVVVYVVKTAATNMRVYDTLLAGKLAAAMVAAVPELGQWVLALCLAYGLLAFGLARLEATGVVPRAASIALLGAAELGAGARGVWGWEGESKGPPAHFAEMGK